MLLNNLLGTSGLTVTLKVVAGLQIILSQAQAGKLNFFQWLEKNSTFVGLVETVVVAAAASLVWGIHFKRERRAAATFSFYACFRLLLNELKKRIKINNPYDAILTLELRREIAQEKGETTIKSTDASLKEYAAIAERLRELILKVDNNIYPRRKKRKEWYANQQELYMFTCFVLDREGVEMEMKDKNIPQEKKKALEDTINDLLSEIEKAKF